MKWLFDFFPIILFFGAYKLGDIYLATITAIFASLFQVCWIRYKQGRFERLPLITLIILIVFGGATLFFRNELFIKWKPTVLYWTLATAFFLSHFIGRSPLIQKMLQENIELPRKIWNRLNVSWILFFSVMGFANLYVAYHFDTDTWVNFKLFGTLALTLVFVILQGFYMTKHYKPVLNKEKTHEPTS